MHEPPSQRYYYCQQFQNIVHNIFGAYYLRASFQFFFLHLEICSQTFLQFEWKIYVRETNPSWIRIFSGQREKSRYLILREEQQIDSQPATTPTWNHFANKLTSQQEERKNLNESWRIFNMYTARERYAHFIQQSYPPCGGFYIQKKYINVHNSWYLCA